MSICYFYSEFRYLARRTRDLIALCVLLLEHTLTSAHEQTVVATYMLPRNTILPTYLLIMMSSKKAHPLLWRRLLACRGVLLGRVEVEEEKTNLSPHLYSERVLILAGPLKLNRSNN